MLTSKTKHYLHVALYLSFIGFIEISTGGVKLWDDDKEIIDPWEKYGFFWTLVLYAFRCVMFLSLPQVFFNFCGLVFYNTFPDKVVLKGSPILAPFVCIRVVTRGDFPQLVKSNVQRNMNKCIDSGLENFLIEVITDKAIGLKTHRRIREIVVPPSYRTKTGALFKSRALQYGLEDSVNILGDNDWIVHLDEETILTENSVRGILNFVMDGKYHFGQGLITYANEEVVNWLTTLADTFRVADDMGKLRFQFLTFHQPWFSWKGSYVVTQLGAEKAVSFDNGLDGSVAEDCYFAMKAHKEGYKFNFIDGEMWEKSPFTLMDFIQQRKRWLQGILLVVHSKTLPLRKKFLLIMSFYAWMTLPLCTINIFLVSAFPTPFPPVLNFICSFICAVSIYMYIFGVLKSFSIYRSGVLKFSLCLMGAILTMPFNLLIENIAVIWGVFGKKHKFYIVDKNISSRTMTV